MPDTDLLPAQVVRERRWVYAHWMDHVTIGEMRRLSSLPPKRGGLGYELHESALNGLLDGALSEAGIVVDPDKGRERYRALATLDRRIRELEDLAKPIDKIATEAAAHEMNVSVKRLIRLHPQMIVQQDRRVMIAAQRELTRLEAQRAVMIGYNAPERSEVVVTVVDQVTDELNEMLAALDLPPIEAAT
jgi:hypothetical protein